jgi:hypothetical protein
MKIAEYACNALAFVLGAWIAATALDSGAASSTEAIAASGQSAPLEASTEVPTTVDYGPHLETH